MTNQSTPADFLGLADEESFCTIPVAAISIGVAYWKLQRAINRGEVPYYTPFNSRKLLRLSEVRAYIESTRKGGIDVCRRYH